MTQTARPFLSVIIAVYNGEETIGDCLRDLFESEYRDFEVIVTDDGSTDGTQEFLEAYPCRVVRSRNGGPAAARNIAATRARGEVLFFLDADILVEADSLGKLVEVFQSQPETGALFGSFGVRTRPRNFVTVYKNLMHHYTHQTAEREAATFCGGFGAIRRELFEAIGGFDPRHRFLEDVEMGMRLHRAGVKIVLQKELQFTHCKRYSLVGLVRSDLFGRAVPWTRLILSERVFRNDLNTRTHNMLSVPCSLALATGLPLAAVAGWVGYGWPAVACVAALAGCLAWLNRKFLGFLAGEKGVGFALRAFPLLWLGYLYSALGVAIGSWLHFTNPRGVLKPEEQLQMLQPEWAEDGDVKAR